MSLDRRADPAAVHGGRRRPPVPRVRDHARGLDLHLAGRLADAHADDVRAAAAAPSPTTQQGWFYRKTGAFLDGVIARLRTTCCGWCCGTSRLTLLVALATLVLTVVLYVGGAEGLLPGAGHRRHPGDHRGAAVGVVRGDGRAAAGGGARHPARSRTSHGLSSFIGIDGSNADAEQRPHARSR